MARRKKSTKTKGFRWGKFLVICGLVTLLCVVGGGAILYFVAKGYLHSDKFRLMLSERASDVFKANGEFDAFSWTGSSVYSDKYTGAGFSDAAFSKVKVEGIDAQVDIGGVKRGVWAIPDVKIQRLNVLINQDRLNRDAGTGVDASGSPESEAIDDRGFFQRLLPEKVEISKVRVQELNFDFAPPEAERIRGREIEVVVVPTDTEQVFKIDGSKGTIEIGVLPENIRTMEITDFALRTAGDRYFLDDANLRFRDAEPGKVEVTGELKGGAIPDLALKARFRDVPGDRVLPADWVQQLKGNFSGEMDISGPGGRDISGTVSLADGSLEALPVLENIDRLAETKKFRRLLLTTLKAEFKKNADRLSIREFDIESAGIVCAKGWLDYNEGNLQSGRYMLGVTPDTIRWMPEWKKKIVEEVFHLDTASAFAGLFPGNPDAVVPSAGYRWTVVAVDPLAAEPYAADLRAQFIEAGGLALWAELEGLSEKAIGVATDMAKEATDQGVNLLDIVTGTNRDRVFSEEGLEKMGDSNEGRPNKNGGLLDLPASIMKTGVETIDILNPFGQGGKLRRDRDEDKRE